jgi:hypothetical protein
MVLCVIFLGLPVRGAFWLPVCRYSLQALIRGWMLRQLFEHGSAKACFFNIGLNYCGTFQSYTKFFCYLVYQNSGNKAISADKTGCEVKLTEIKKVFLHCPPN